MISLREFVLGRQYKTPQGRPYDPWEILKLWNAQEADEPNSNWFFNPSTNLYDIPRYEFDGLNEWEHTRKESERPPSPLASPMDLAKLVHQPPPNPDGTPLCSGRGLPPETPWRGTCSTSRKSPARPEVQLEPPMPTRWQNMSYAGSYPTRGFMSGEGARGRTYRIASG